MNQTQTQNTESAWERIAVALEKLANAAEALANIQLASMQNALRDRPREKLSFPLGMLPNMNWAEYGYEPLEKDRHGIPLAVRCTLTGKIFKRHNGNKTFGNGIIYSRSLGKDNNGKVNYEVAVVFSDKINPPEEVPTHILDAMRAALPAPSGNAAQPKPKRTGPEWAKYCTDIAKTQKPDRLMQAIREWMAEVGEKPSDHSGVPLSNVVRYMIEKYGK